MTSTDRRSIQHAHHSPFVTRPIHLLTLALVIYRVTHELFLRPYNSRHFSIYAFFNSFVMLALGSHRGQPIV